METKLACTHCGARLSMTLRDDEPVRMQLSRMQCPDCGAATLIEEIPEDARRAETERLRRLISADCH